MLYTLLKVVVSPIHCMHYIDTGISSITATGQKRPPPSVGGEEASAKRSQSGVFSVCVYCMLYVSLY